MHPNSTKNGTKLKKTVVNNGVTDLIQDYVGGIEYKTTPSVPIALEAIYHSEGRITTINGSLKYEYALRDHLGNTRLMFCDKTGDGVITQSLSPENSEVSQENHYYPFGLAMEGTWANTPSVLDNKYQYNGKELNSDFGLEWLDYGARFYDASDSRFWSVDKMADEPEQLDKSPYAYAWNNPVKLTDPDGNCPRCLKALVKSVVKSVVKGKVDLGEVYDAIDAGKTLLSSNSTLLERGEAIFNLVSPISTKEFKAAKKFITKTDDAADAADAAKAVRKAPNLEDVTPFDRSKSTNINEVSLTVNPDDKIDRSLLNPPAKSGNAPTFKSDGTPVELHHQGQNPNGPFTEMHWEAHRGAGNDKKNHPNKTKPSSVDRKEFNKDKKEYWNGEFPK